MKALGAVRHQVKQVSFRHLKKRLEAGLRPRPSNCVHNRVMRHPKLTAAGDGPCGVCICPKQEGDVLCDPVWGGVAKAKGCEFFEALADKDTLKAGFKAWLSTAQLHEVAAECPDLAALLWVLQDEAPGREVEIPDDEDWEPEGDTEEVFEVVVANVTLRTVSSDDAEAVKVELSALALAIETANHLNTTREGELETAEATTTQLRLDLDAKSTVYLETMDELAEALLGQERLQADLDARPELPAPRVSWWTRLFGGGQ